MLCWLNGWLLLSNKIISCCCRYESLIYVWCCFKHRRPLSDAVIPTDKISPAASVLPVPLIYTNRPPWSSSPWKFWSQQDCNSLLLNWARKNGTSHQQSIGENEMGWITSIHHHLICHLFHLKFPLFSLTGWWWWAWNGDKEPVQRWGWLIFIFNIFNPTSCAEVRLWSVSEAQWLICKKTSNDDGPGMKK